MLALDEDVYRSATATNHRNRSLARLHFHAFKHRQISRALIGILGRGHLDRYRIDGVGRARAEQFVQATGKPRRRGEIRRVQVQHHERLVGEAVGDFAFH